MRRLLLHGACLLATLTSAVAETAAQLVADFDKECAVVLRPIDAELEQALKPLIEGLTQKGDSAGAEKVQEQMRDKIAGYRVVRPHAGTEDWFTAYSIARRQLLEPVVKKYRGLMNKLPIRHPLQPKNGMPDSRTEEDRVLQHIMNGQEPDRLPFTVEWTYRKTTDGPVLAEVFLVPGGTAGMKMNEGRMMLLLGGMARVEGSSGTVTGKWEMTPEGTVKVELPKDTWTVTLNPTHAIVESTATGRGCLVPVQALGSVPFGF